MTGSRPIVSATDVTKYWDATSGLAPVSFTVQEGDKVAVQGRSGTGKSTLIAVLAGWCEPEDGTVTWHTARARTPWWADIAVVPQLLVVDDELSVRENVEVVLRATGSPPAAAHELAAQELARLDLADLADRWPTEISHGQRQRLAVARALVHGPKLLLADEPTSQQDVDHADLVLAAIDDRAGAGMGVVIAGHDAAVLDHATHVITLT